MSKRDIPKIREGFTFYRSFRDAIEMTDATDQLVLYKAIADYALDGIEPDISALDVLGRLCWTAISPSIKSGRKNFENGCNGGAPKGNCNAKKQPKNNRDSTEKQPAQTSNENEKENENEEKKLPNGSKESADKPRKRRRPSPASPSPDEFEEIVKFYNDTCKSLRPVKTLTDKRREAVSARLREHGREAVFDVIRAAGRSSFLAGQNTREWTADFDWIFRPVNFVKVLEGKYENKEKSQQHGNESDQPSVTSVKIPL